MGFSLWPFFLLAAHLLHRVAAVSGRSWNVCVCIHVACLECVVGNQWSWPPPPSPPPQLRVTLWDFFPSPQVRSLARTDEARGLLWLLEEEALVPGATEDTLLERLFSYYGPQEGDKKGGYPWRAAPRFLS